MLTKKRLLANLEQWYKESGNEQFLYLLIGLRSNRLSISETENARHKIQFPEMHNGG